MTLTGKQIYLYFSLILVTLCLIGCDSLIGNGNRQIDAWIDGHHLRLEVAATPEIRTKGLMHRTKLGENEGMLFVWGTSRKRSFWMKDTLIPLDVAYFDDQFFLINVQSMQPQGAETNYGNYPALEPTRYAVETNIGWFEKHGIKKYARLKLAEDVQGVD